MANLVTEWKSLQVLGVSTIKDALSARYHSRDFMYARTEYMRVRVMLLGLVFAVLTPFWALMDAWLLPSWFTDFLPMRIGMFAGLLLCSWLAYKGQEQVRLIYLLSGLVFAFPALFYAYLLLVSDNSIHYVVQAYGFIPFLLVATLSVFPFTLLESAFVGFGLLGLQLLAGYEKGIWLSAQSLHDLWLLSALLVVSLTANYFHLGLLLRLYRQATHDPLTGLLNRGALTHQIAPLLREERHEHVHVFILDLDYFKQINDTHGHSIGDLVLASTASMLRQVCQPDCWLIRYGGEEFVLLSLGRTDQQAGQLAQRIVSETRLMNFQNHDGLDFQVTVSIGLQRHLPRADLFDTLRQADELLYQAKRSGRNKVESGLGNVSC